MADTLVWITGGSSGIGAALAASVPYDDAHTVDVSRSGGGPADEHLPLDLADPAAWAALEEHLVARVGTARPRRAVLVHCAAVLGPVGPQGAVDGAALHRLAVLDAAAPQAVGHAFLRAVRDLEGECALVQLTSGAATSVYEGWAGYGAGKAAVDQWTRVAGAEQAARADRGEPSCTVLAVSPGLVATPMQELARTGDHPQVEKFVEAHAEGSLADPAAVARAIWELLDDPGIEPGAVVDLRDLRDRSGS